VTQLCKMLILASFFPMSDLQDNKIDIIGEFMKSTMDLADLIGFHIIMTKIPGRGDMKILIAGLGWASAEFLTTKLIPLWVGAKGIEFDWKYTQMSLDSNISLAHYLAVALLIWLLGRTDLQRSFFPVVVLLLGLASYRPLVLELVTYLFGFASWTLLAMKTLYTGVIGALGLQMYLGLIKTFKTY